MRVSATVLLVLLACLRAGAQPCITCFDDTCRDLGPAGLPRCAVPKRARAAAPKAVPGELVVVCDTPCTIAVDGEVVGKDRPRAVTSLPPGEYLVTAQAPARVPASARVTVAAGKPAKVLLELPAVSGTAAEHIEEGDRLFAEKRFPNALVEYRAALALEPTSVNALLKEGLAFACLEYFTGAIASWERVLVLDPGNRYATTYLERARARLQADAAPAAPAEGTSARDNYRAAVTAINEGRFGEAVALLDAAIRKEPGFVSAWTARGGARLGAHAYAAAITDYEQALVLDPGVATPLYGLARAWERLGNRAMARAYYLRYAESSGKDATDVLKASARKAAAALAPP